MALLLTRGEGEVIRIGDDIVVTVVEIGRGKVRLGITAPVEIKVDRDEVYRAKRWLAGQRDDNEV